MKKTQVNEFLAAKERERKWGFPEQRVVEHSVEEADDDEP